MSAVPLAPGWSRPAWTASPYRSCFLNQASSRPYAASSAQRCRAESERVSRSARRRPEHKEEPSGLGLKAVWYGAEQFGNIFATFAGQKQQKVSDANSALPKLSRKEALDSIKEDYQANYFVNGAGDMSAYEDDCLFTDPFSGFRGTQRFKRNIGNFGNFLEDVKLDIMEFREVDNGLRTRWRFGATLKFPWRPRLAAAGRTTHYFSDETNRVVEHREEWDTEVGKVLQQLLKPGKQSRNK